MLSPRQKGLIYDNTFWKCPLRRRKGVHVVITPNPWKPEKSDERIPIGPPDTISKFKGDL